MAGPTEILRIGDLDWMKYKKCVHTEHCCRNHGCKYGQEDSCPVWLGYKLQSYACETCDVFDGIDKLEKVPKVKATTFRERRKKAEDPWSQM